MKNIKDKIVEILAPRTRLNDHGHEMLDTKPVAVPVNLPRGESMDERITRIIQHSMAVRKAGYETFEEADNFDIPDDPLDPHTPYEKDFDMAAVAGVDAGVVKSPPPINRKAADILDEYVVQEEAKKARFRKKEEQKSPAPTEPPK